MRAIKFRAWNKVTNEWVWKVPFNLQVIAGCNGEALGAFKNGPYMKEVTFMQYTGLKDKNGKEIYEGDILKAENYPLLAIIYEGCSWVCVQELITAISTRWNLNTFSYTPLEIIGNIYENPELLHGKTEANKAKGFPDEVVQ